MPERQQGLSARKTVAANVRTYREKLGISQERLAELSGFHRTYVSQVERALSNITVDNLEALATQLKVQPYVLLRPARESE